MDALGETMENVGLAQEIKNGLAKTLQKPPKFSEMAAEIGAKKSEIGGMSSAQVYAMPLGKYCIDEWAKAGNVDLSQARRRSSAGGAGGGTRAAR